jgi:hypothetical protein
LKLFPLFYSTLNYLAYYVFLYSFLVKYYRLCFGSLKKEKGLRMKKLLVFLTLVLLLTPSSSSVYAQERDAVVEISFVPEMVWQDLVPITSTIEIRYGDCADAQISIEFQDGFNYHLTENNPGDSDLFSIKDAVVLDPDLGIYQTTFEAEFTPLPWWFPTEPGSVYAIIGDIGISCGGGEIVSLGEHIVGLKTVPWQNFLPLILH